MQDRKSLKNSQMASNLLYVCEKAKIKEYVNKIKI
jgi:hypothetical protein